jgi:hypothetical protein
MLPQLTLDLVNKLPFSEVPLFGGKTKPIKQTEIQAEGCWVVGDPHPLYEGLYFRDLKKNKRQRWQTAEQREAEVAQAYKYEKENKDAKRAYRERNKEHISKKAAQYYLDNWEKKQKYREGRRLETRAKCNAHYAKKKAYYQAKNVRRRTENIKLTGDYKDALEEIHDLRMALDLAAVGAGVFPEGYNGQSRWSFELHHLMPLLEYKDFYCGLDAPWNVEILSVQEHRVVHTRASPSEH